MIKHKAPYQLVKASIPTIAATTPLIALKTTTVVLLVDH
jgi:hypothetical protein